jgi:hypothetical protein
MQLESLHRYPLDGSNPPVNATSLRKPQITPPPCVCITLFHLSYCPAHAACLRQRIRSTGSLTRKQIVPPTSLLRTNLRAFSLGHTTGGRRVPSSRRRIPSIFPCNGEPAASKHSLAQFLLRARRRSWFACPQLLFSSSAHNKYAGIQ